MDLLDRWGKAAGRDEAALVQGRALLGRWAEPHRRYHDLRHLAEVLAALDRLARGPVPRPVVLAAFFHDAVYDLRPGEDERRSAGLAADVLAALGVPAVEVEEVARLVLLTARHDWQAGDEAGALLCDGDLAVLAAPHGRYAEYAADVREEYRSVPDAAFRAGRAAVLRGLLARPVFSPAAAHLEAAARRNVSAELAVLEESAARPPSAG